MVSNGCRVPFAPLGLADLATSDDVLRARSAGSQKTGGAVDHQRRGASIGSPVINAPKERVRAPPAQRLPQLVGGSRPISIAALDAGGVSIRSLICVPLRHYRNAREVQPEKGRHGHPTGSRTGVFGSSARRSASPGAFDPQLARANRVWSGLGVVPSLVSHMTRWVVKTG
jgi:hypothetical protein